MTLSAELSGKDLRQFHLDFSGLEIAKIAELKIKTEKSGDHRVTIIPKKSFEDHINWSFEDGMMHHWGWDKKFKEES